MSLKPDKTLRWLPHTGSVQLSIELKDRKISTQATPLQASVIDMFSDTGKESYFKLCLSNTDQSPDIWLFEDLITIFQAQNDISSIRNALFFWANLGLLTTHGNEWHLLENASTAQPSTKHGERGVDLV